MGAYYIPTDAYYDYRIDSSHYMVRVKCYNCKWTGWAVFPKGKEASVGVDAKCPGCECMTVKRND